MVTWIVIFVLNFLVATAKRETSWVVELTLGPAQATLERTVCQDLPGANFTSPLPALGTDGTILAYLKETHVLSF